MKNFILIVGLVALTGCAKEPVAEKTSDSEQYVSGAATQQEAATNTELQGSTESDAKELTPDQAKKFAVQLLKKLMMMKNLFVMLLS